MFQEALNYPRNSDSAVKTIAIGGLLLFLSFLVVPTFFVVGYVVRTLRAVLHGIEEPPAFDGWGDLLVDGLKAVAIGLAYSLVPAVIAIVAVVTSGATLGLTGPGRSGGLVVALIALGALALLTVVSLVLAYVLPAAIVAWVRTDTLGAAFSPAELRVYAFSKGYATGWVVAVGISLLAALVSGALGAVFVGALLTPFITFYANVAGAHAIGTAVREMPALEDGSETPVSQPAD